ncbi:MAG: sigma 54-interacting transcriptional regulator [Candidatus Zixiibacteriota bacterium]
MNADDLERNELIRMGGDTIEFLGRRLMILSQHALEHLINDLSAECDSKTTERLVFRFAYFWGYADASALRRSFSWESTNDFLRAGCRLMEIAGIASTSIPVLSIHEETNTIDIQLEWRGRKADGFGASETEPSDDLIDRIVSAYMSGFASFGFDREILFVPDNALGSAESRKASGKSIESWGDGQVTIYETDDIRERISKLAGGLKEEIEDRRRRRAEAAVMSTEMKPYFMEFRSRQLQSVLYMADRVARFNTSVLITGESGVGKEVLSLYIHKKSPREKAPFVTVNCSALPETLLESELFGHKAGSFTGAVKDRIGLFENAANGTIFLDEIGDITPATQLKLLRVLQEKEIVRVGENTPRKVDVRIIAATNKDLDTAITEGTFRDDLLYRLRVVEIEIPPLRERREDILPLARFITRRLAQKMEIDNLLLASQCIDYLNRYSWPGNVRELENAIERAAVFCENGTIRPEDLPSHVTRGTTLPDQSSDASAKSLSDIERAHIIEVLDANNWNKSRTAAILAVSPSTLWRKMREYDIRK